MLPKLSQLLRVIVWTAAALGAALLTWAPASEAKR